MKISEQEIKKVRKTLLLNLVVADLVLLAGLLLNWQDGPVYIGHKWQIISFALIVLGGVWVVMTVSRMIRLRKFLSDQRK